MKKFLLILLITSIVGLGVSSYILIGVKKDSSNIEDDIKAYDKKIKEATEENNKLTEEYKKLEEETKDKQEEYDIWKKSENKLD